MEVNKNNLLKNFKFHYLVHCVCHFDIIRSSRIQWHLFNRTTRE